MKSEKELNELKAEFEALKEKLEELNAEELEQVAGGRHNIRSPLCGDEK